MKIVIVGAGRMGTQLARHLDQEDHQVTVIDSDPQRIEMLKTRFDVLTLVGSGAQVRTLREAGLDDADLLITATNSDEVNIVACLLSREMKIRRRIARVNSGELIEDLRSTSASIHGVDEFIYPLEVTVHRLSHLVVNPGTVESAEFAGGQVVLRALTVPSTSPMAGVKLRDLHNRCPSPFLIAAVRRQSEITVPKGDFEILPDDVVYAVMRRDHLKAFLTAFDFQGHKVRRVMIYGAQRLGIALCRQLETLVQDVILIDPDQTLCDIAAEQLNSTSVIKGSPLDKPLMNDLKMDGVDAFMAMHEVDQTNLAPALLAKQLGAKRALMLSNHPEHVDLFESLPLDAVVSPLLLAVSAVLRAVRHGRVVSLFKLSGDRAEALEVEATAGAKGVGQPLRDLSVPAGMVVAAVSHKGATNIPDGNTVIESGDRLVLVALRDICSEGVHLFSSGDAL